MKNFDGRELFSAKLTLVGDYCSEEIIETGEAGKWGRGKRWELF